MARKKKTNRKKNNIESLTPKAQEMSETSQSTETVEESPQNATEMNPASTEESTQSSPPDTAEPAESAPNSATATPPTPAEPAEKPTQSSPPANPPATEKKPYLAIKPKPIPTKFADKKPLPPPVTEATNEADELFHKGDSITVKAPWGGEATAEIVDFYQTHSGKIWAQYNPLDFQPNWTWYSGCIRTNLLAKATQTAQE